MQYTVLWSRGTDLNDVSMRLDNSVNGALQQGWQLQGGVSFSSTITEAPLGCGYSREYYLAQAVVRG